MGFFSYKWNKLVGFFVNNKVKVLQFVGCMFIVSCPFTIWYHVENFPNEFGGRVILILLFMFFSYIFFAIAKFYHDNEVPEDIPVPAKRFTYYNVNDDCVYVSRNRIQEMYLYLADLEDWMEDHEML